MPKREPYSSSGNKPYAVFSKTYYPLSSPKNYRERGIASWYGKKFHGKRTSTGEAYDMYAMTAAHKTLPIPCYARVRNLRNGSSVVVRVNDRGPFLENRLIDLSYAAASRLGILATGTGLVEVEAIDLEAPTTLQAKAPSAPAVASAEPAVVTTVSLHAAPAPRLPTPEIYVQVGAFSDLDNAERQRSALYRAGFAGVTIESEANLHRVRLGPVPDVEASDALLRRASSAGFDQAYVVIE